MRPRTCGRDRSLHCIQIRDPITISTFFQFHCLLSHSAFEIWTNDRVRCATVQGDCRFMLISLANSWKKENNHVKAPWIELSNLFIWYIPIHCMAYKISKISFCIEFAYNEWIEWRKREWNVGKFKTFKTGMSCRLQVVATRNNRK